MRKELLDIAIAGVPKQYAVFRVINVPERVSAMLSIGDLMYAHVGGTMVRVKDSRGMMLGHESLDFVAYMTASQMQETD